MNKETHPNVQSSLHSSYLIPTHNLKPNTLICSKPVRKHRGSVSSNIFLDVNPHKRGVTNIISKRGGNPLNISTNYIHPKLSNITQTKILIKRNSTLVETRKPEHSKDAHSKLRTFYINNDRKNRAISLSNNNKITTRSYEQSEVSPFNAV